MTQLIGPGGGNGGSSGGVIASAHGSSSTSGGFTISDTAFNTSLSTTLDVSFQDAQETQQEAIAQQNAAHAQNLNGLTITQSFSQHPLSETDAVPSAVTVSGTDTYRVYTPPNAEPGNVIIITVSDQGDTTGALADSASLASEIAINTGATVIVMTQAGETAALDALQDYASAHGPISNLTITAHGAPNHVWVDANTDTSASTVLNVLAQSNALADQVNITFWSCNVGETDAARQDILNAVQAINTQYGMTLNVTVFDKKQAPPLYLDGASISLDLGLFEVGFDIPDLIYIPETGDRFTITPNGIQGYDDEALLADPLSHPIELIESIANVYEDIAAAQLSNLQHRYSYR